MVGACTGFLSLSVRIWFWKSVDCILRVSGIWADVECPVPVKDANFSLVHPYDVDDVVSYSELVGSVGLLCGGHFLA